MRVPTGTAWPANLLMIFDICRRQYQSTHDRYYAPYTTLLHHCFNPRADSPRFLVGPPGQKAILESADFLTVTTPSCRPLVVVDVHDESWINRASMRLKADEEMRRRCKEMFADCPLPHLWGLSLLGTSLRVYNADVATRKIEPRLTDHPSPNHPVPDNLLEGAWNIDILSQEGFTKMQEIVTDVVNNTEAQKRA